MWIEYTVGKSVSFHYNGRQVRGVVTEVGYKYIVVKLTYSYLGENDGWNAGELKLFFTDKIKQ